MSATDECHIGKESKMATLYSRSLKFLKLAWVQQPVLFISTVFGALGPLIVFLSPLSEGAIKANQDIPMKYPYPEVSKSEGS